MIGRTDLWYKDAIIYELDVETFQDGNGDGLGDFPGLTRRLDHLVTLGASCVWLLPFYPSPNRDNGYDVSDYYAIDPRLGTLGDFVDFTRAARERGIRVLADLVVNHTSDQHPWFQRAREEPDSPYRDYYVWSREEPEEPHDGVIFPGQQESVWTWDEKAGAWYLHRFYEHQPDLNVANPAVRDEIRKIMGFWLELGVSGFRVDAVPFVIEHKGIDPAHIETRNPYEYLERMREFLQWRRGDAVLLAEANVAPEEIQQYFGDGDRMHLLFDFYSNQHLFLALATGEGDALAHALAERPEIPRFCQWAQFLRNHDELDLGRLSDADRERVFEAMAPREDMRLFGRGIRRRLPPMLDGDRRRLELAYSLMFTLPGTPVLRYGDEIGMGDDLSLEGRSAVRTPMQWSDEANGGFSSAPTEQLPRPLVTQGSYAYECVNVRDQARDPHSLMNWMRHMLRIRRGCPEIGWGDWSVVRTDDPCVFAHLVSWQDGVVLAVHNLDAKPRTVSLDLGAYSGRDLVDLLEGRRTLTVDSQRVDVELPRHGYRWFRIGEEVGFQHRESED